MRRLHGFSLMEMMIVLTIVAIVAAASAPMVNKKMVRAASEKSPWVFTNGESIGYNIDNENGIQDRKTATIGANGRVPNTGGNPRLYIDTNSDTTPHILFGRRGGNLIRLIAGGDKNNIWLSNANIPAELSESVAIGTDIQAIGSGGVSIGERGSLRGDGAIAIGGQASASLRSIAIGISSSARNDDTIAVGSRTIADAESSVAIGSQAKATDVAGVAIGYKSEASKASIGINGKANGGSSIAINGNAPSNNSIAIGWGANAASNNSLAFGYKARTGSGNVSGNQSDGKQIALGYGADAKYYESIALGAGCAASNYRSAAIGSRSNAFGRYSIALGGTAIADANYAAAIGTGARAVAPFSMAIGTNARAVGYRSMAIGCNADTTADNTIVLGDENTTVVIPGTVQFKSLRVSGNATIDGSLAVKTTVFIKTGRNGRQTGDQWVYLGTKDYKGSDDNFWKCGTPWFVSDRRLKNVGKEFTSGLDKLKKLEVFNYTFKDDKDKTPQVGVMAQDLQKIFPDAVMKGEDGFLRIRMEDMFYAVINAVKELDTRTSAQEKKIQELEKRIEELEKLVKQS